MRDISMYPLSQPRPGAAGKTGSWRSARPVLDGAKCTGCQLCWLFCPEGAVARESRAIDLDYCKGCGICARECPVHALEMRKEED